MLSTDFFLNSQIPNFTKFLPVGDELTHADGPTERHDSANTHFS